MRRTLLYIALSSLVVTTALATPPGGKGGAPKSTVRQVRPAKSQLRTPRAHQPTAVESLREQPRQPAAVSQKASGRLSRLWTRISVGMGTSVRPGWEIGGKPVLPWKRGANKVLKYYGIEGGKKVLKKKIVQKPGRQEVTELVAFVENGEPKRAYRRYVIKPGPNPNEMIVDPTPGDSSNYEVRDHAYKPITGLGQLWKTVHQSVPWRVGEGASMKLALAHGGLAIASAAATSLGKPELGELLHQTNTTLAVGGVVTLFTFPFLVIRPTIRDLAVPTAVGAKSHTFTRKQSKALQNEGVAYQTLVGAVDHHESAKALYKADGSSKNRNAYEKANRKVDRAYKAHQKTLTKLAELNVQLSPTEVDPQKVLSRFQAE